MKKILALTLALFILTLTGCSKTENTSSDIVINSSEIISSTDESSSEIDTSSDETSSETSSDVSSSQTSTPSKTESSSTPNNSSKVENNTSTSTSTPSKNETSSTTTTTTPSTYFEKHNLKLSPLTTNVCFNNDTNHNCGKKTITVETLEIETEYYNPFNEDVFGTSFDSSTYKNVKYDILTTTLLVNCGTGGYEDGGSGQYVTSGGHNLLRTIAFDKYTGIIYESLPAVKEGTTWRKFTVNNSTFYIDPYGLGACGWNYTHEIYCPKSYDGIIFVVAENIDWNFIYNGKQHTIDEVIDFENDKYYLFAANS